MTAKSKKQGGFGMKPCLAVLTALLALISCRKEMGGSQDEGVCVVKFSASGAVEAQPLATKASVPLPEGAGVGVAAYERVAGGAAPAPAQDIWKAANTYAVQSGGALSASLVGADGKPVAGAAAEMELNSGTYDFYAYSPALQTEADKYTIKGIAHYTDFMGALVPGSAVSRTASRVDLKFEHKCSKVRFNVVTAADMENSSLAAEDAVLYKMAVSPARDFVLGGDLTPTVGSATDKCQLKQIEAAADGKSASVWEVLLPKSNGSFDADFYLKINGTSYVLKAQNIPAMSFTKGVQHIFTAVVRKGSADLVLDVASWDVVPEDVNAGEGGGTDSDSWEEGGNAGGSAGANHGLVIGSWENIDWSGSIGGNFDPVTGALAVGSWVPAQVLVDAGGMSAADVDSWVRKALEAQAGADHGGAVGDWNGNEFAANMGGGADMSNCAMLVPGSGDAGAVTFDIRKCINNGFTTAEDLNRMMGAASTLTADVLWQDGNVINTADVSLDKINGLLTVRSSKATQGNAVVALYPNSSKAQGTILWSWHIWVTDYRPDEAGVATRAANTKYDVTGGQVHTYGTEFQKTNGTSRVIMDRNLGATKAYNAGAPTAGDATAQEAFGMIYQWGRKDPLPRATCDNVAVNSTYTAKTITIYGPDGTSTMAEDGTGYKKVNVTTVGAGPNLSYAVKNPLTFIYSSSGIFDWYATAQANQSDALWDDGAGKSAYDPCPKGWRIAPDGTWSDFTRTSATAGTFLYYYNGTKTETISNSTYYLTDGRYYIPTSGTVRAWYPAPGYRAQASGVLTSVGGGGYSWSSTVSSTGGVLLYFGYAGLNPSNAYGRATGLQVRCIQDLE